MSEEKTPIQIKTHLPEGVFRQYADHVQVTGSSFGITIDFVDITHITQEETEAGYIKRAIKYRITLPARITESLRDLLTDALKAHGEVEENKNDPKS